MIPTNPSYKDVGIITPDDLNFSKYCSRLANIALARANLILRTFHLAMYKPYANYFVSK